MKKPHFLLVSFPAQGHINPTLQLAKILVRLGAAATFVTPPKAYSRISSSFSITTTTTTITSGISFATISDGTESGSGVDSSDPMYPAQFESHGPSSLAALVRSFADSGRSVSCIVYNFLLPWVADVAVDLGVPSALLWIQPSAVLAVYYHFIVKSPHLFTDLSQKIQLPGLPPLAAEELPSFVLPDNPFPLSVPIFCSMFRAVEESKSKWVLVNSFDALEECVVSSLKEVNLDVIGVGPLIPSAFLDKKRSSDQDMAFGGDLHSPISGCNVMHWLDLKEAGSVLYASFGTLAMLSPVQVDEIAAGLLESGHYFIWVVRLPENYGGFPAGFDEAVKKRGLLVKWCRQVEVLAHPSVGCFVTHSGWNSTLEGLVNGKPMVCVPQWSDQPTNAKLVEQVWRIGVRARKNQEGVVGREELKRCVNVVMGEESGKEMRKKALRWRELAVEAATADGGTSDRNIRTIIGYFKPEKEDDEKSIEQEPDIARLELAVA
ncbi:UDP-glycosyltransferase 75C1-like [Nymphaea colorata]|uniref:Glycosyltransferase n=1 Tax=Nymphaea colorata TaxID=210225 RepID=A0A5K1BAX5_9MAGN|nr:UDP-glycosyltransferase 75C1-like [Nymphaea colorata]